MNFPSYPLAFVPVSTQRQYRDLLLIRNECRDGLTHHTAEITLAEQYKFQDECWGPKWTEKGIATTEWYEPFLLLRWEEPIGYGLLKHDVLIDGYWMTAGLIKSERGKGLSRLLILYITEMGHRDGKEVWIDVYDDNLAIYGDIRVGYEYVDSQTYDDKLLHTMRHNRERIVPEREAWKLAHRSSQS